jgi:hypothetical protein
MIGVNGLLTISSEPGSRGASRPHGSETGCEPIADEAAARARALIVRFQTKRVRPLDIRSKSFTRQSGRRAASLRFVGLTATLTLKVWRNG